MTAEKYGVLTANSLEEAAGLGTVILAVPDPEVISCIKVFNELKKPLTVINVSTNVAQHVLAATAAAHIKCIGVKFVGHADEIMHGQDSIIIVNDEPAELVTPAREIFRLVGKVRVGKADLVSVVNTVAAERVLVAAVEIEENLRRQGVVDDEIIRSAIHQVAAGILRAYANGDLGPFAREVVRAVRARLKKREG